MKQQKLVLINEDGQHEPTKNLVRDNPVKKVQKFYSKNHENWENSQLPDFRFFCRQCGSLDVSIDIKNSTAIGGACLDCKYKWKEDEFYV